MTVVLVDTDVWIDFFSGQDPGQAAVRRLLVEKRAVLSAITVFELFAGVRSHKRVEQLEALISAVPVLPLSLTGARIAAEAYTYLKNRGRLVGNADLLLAGTAAELDIPVLTRNRQHFERIKGLKVLDPAKVAGG